MVPMSPFAASIFSRTYAFNEHETWEGCAQRVAKAVAENPDQERRFFEIIRDRVFVPGGRYLYSSGRPKFFNSNCYGTQVGDSREAWAKLLHDATMCLSTGGGLGTNYSLLRPSGSAINTLGGTASGPISLMQMVNEVARHVMAGGRRRSALWAGLRWDHPDIMQLVTIKDWDEDFRAMKAKKFDYPAPLDMTNVSVIVNDGYFRALAAGDKAVWLLHATVCESMRRHGEPGFWNESLIQRDSPNAVTANACTESTLSDRDSCNLGSIVLPRIRDLAHLEDVTRLAVRFLYNGSIKGTYPTDEIGNVVFQNRRIGLGLIGLHEFMLSRGHRYEWFPELEQWTSTWAQVSREEADRYAIIRGGASPCTVRAIAPTGTISIVAETTSGVEPIFCSAYKRRYIDHGQGRFQFVIDPTAKRLLDAGVPENMIEDAYGLATDIPRRLSVQAALQRHVDQAISNTINLPPYGTEGNNNPTAFSTVIADFLPSIKGLTCYPDGSRSGQPLSPVPVHEAAGQEGVVYEEEGERCIQGACAL
jgi:ribonucleoside-diphosphate reductase alpha chain